MPDPETETPAQPESEDDLDSLDLDALARRALRQAVLSGQRRDEQTAKAIKFYRRTAVLLLVVVAALVGLYFLQKNAADSRATKTDNLVICNARGLNDLGQDLRLAVTATHRVPRSAIKIPSACTLSP